MEKKCSVNSHIYSEDSDFLELGVTLQDSPLNFHPFPNNEDLSVSL